MADQNLMYNPNLKAVIVISNRNSIMTTPKSRIFNCNLAVAMLSLAYASAAHAGHWEIKYQADGAVQYTASSQYHPEDAGSTIGGNPFNKSLKGYSGGASWVDSDLLPGGIGRDSFGSSVSVGTSFNFGFDKYHGAVDDGGSVTAILQWTPENASDQQTPPTRIHLRETSRVSASGSFSTYYGASYTQEPFSLDVTNGAGGAVQESQSDGTTTKTAKSDRLLEIANPSASSVVHVPTRTFRAQASGGFFRWEDLINNITSFGVSAEISYTVQIVGFEMTVSRRGSGKDLSHSATVAAGGKSTDEHQADILIQAYPPLAGLLVAPRISVGESGETANGAITLDSGVTDANGQIKGTYKSSDVIQPVTLRLDVGEGPSAEDRINQVWADKTDAALWQYDPILDTENPNPITFKPTFQRRRVRPHHDPHHVFRRQARGLPGLGCRSWRLQRREHNQSHRSR